MENPFSYSYHYNTFSRDIGTFHFRNSYYTRVLGMDEKWVSYITDILNDAYKGGFEDGAKEEKEKKNETN